MEPPLAVHFAKTHCSLSNPFALLVPHRIGFGRKPTSNRSVLRSSNGLFFFVRSIVVPPDLPKRTTSIPIVAHFEDVDITRSIQDIRGTLCVGDW